MKIEWTNNEMEILTNAWLILSRKSAKEFLEEQNDNHEKALRRTAMMIDYIRRGRENYQEVTGIKDNEIVKYFGVEFLEF